MKRFAKFIYRNFGYMRKVDIGTKDDLTPEDIHYDEEIEKYKESILQFERIVGDSPLDQIDWIIKHGLTNYREWLDRCTNGLKQYDSPLIVRENKAYRVVEEITYVRGGIGNRIVGWNVKKVIDHTGEKPSRYYGVSLYVKEDGTLGERVLECN